MANYFPNRTGFLRKLKCTKIAFDYNYTHYKLGMQILIGYKIAQLAPKHKLIVSTTYIIFFTFMITIYSITILLEGLKVAPQKIWMGYLFFHLIGMVIYFANNKDEFCWNDLLK